MPIENPVKILFALYNFLSMGDCFIQLVYVSQFLRGTEFVKNFNKISCKKRYIFNNVEFCKNLAVIEFSPFVTFCEFVDWNSFLNYHLYKGLDFGKRMLFSKYKEAEYIK